MSLAERYSRSLAFQVGQGIVYAMVVAMFLVWVAFGNRTVAKQNADILSAVRSDITVHGEAVARRTCDMADIMLFFFEHPAHVKGQAKVAFYRTPAELAELKALRDDACLYTPLP